MSVEPWTVDLTPQAEGWVAATIVDTSGLLRASVQVRDHELAVYGDGPTLADALDALAAKVRELDLDLPPCPHEGGWTTEPADPDEGDMTPVTTCDDCGERWGR